MDTLPFIYRGFMIHPEALEHEGSLIYNIKKGIRTVMTMDTAKAAKRWVDDQNAPGGTLSKAINMGLDMTAVIALGELEPGIFSVTFEVNPADVALQDISFHLGAIFEYADLIGSETSFSGTQIHTYHVEIG